jgi:hypothetical protein
MHIPIPPFLIISALAMGFISAYLASKRHRNPYTWFVVGFLFGLLGIFAICIAGNKKKLLIIPPAAPNFKIHGPSDKFWYYLDPAHQQKGPMSLDGLTTAWKNGTVSPETYVWHEEMTEWKPLKDTLKVQI